ncbi:hypothetical protein HPB49_006693 [Dermacentor silvarum]|uniref:Uncharacterized protein n=1 Tax=Dermacentor silvarum TaxID=543639 RepID=A0ACB8C7W9_DERSI|nr:hypothetical protein HPB49_006693 [Dermacentor silvarum]
MCARGQTTNYVRDVQRPTQVRTTSVSQDVSYVAWIIPRPTKPVRPSSKNPTSSSNANGSDKCSSNIRKSISLPLGRPIAGGPDPGGGKRLGPDPDLGPARQ